MVWIKARKLIAFTSVIALSANVAFAQESLWKTFNQFPDQEVPSYNGGLSPFPQKQKKVEELEFEQANQVISNIEELEEDISLSDNERRLMLTTSILAEIKSFLEEESVFIPNLNNIVIEATAKANGKYKALINKIWMEVGSEIAVPVDEARDALDLLERLRDVDEQLAETVENAVLERTSGQGEEMLKISLIESDRVEFKDKNSQKYVVNFIKAPF
ncbi:MAG: hypothetical protein CFH44_00839 [Proteobacteria bacterium]|nr:MAG: hypothetical protein CFH44_00839 [Pseudomonadota bacterium]